MHRRFGRLVDRECRRAVAADWTLPSAAPACLTHRAALLPKDVEIEGEAADLAAASVSSTSNEVHCEPGLRASISAPSNSLLQPNLAIRLASGAIPRGLAATPPACSYETLWSGGNPGQDHQPLSHRPLALISGWAPSLAQAVTRIRSAGPLHSHAFEFLEYKPLCRRNGTINASLDHVPAHNRYNTSPLDDAPWYDFMSGQASRVTVESGRK